MWGRPVVIVAGALVAAIALSGCGGSGDHATAGHAGTGNPTSTAAAPVSGRAGDIAFAQGMIPHHEQAIEMADLALADRAGASAEVRDLAREIKAAQDPEIDQMTAWLAEWGAPVSPSGTSEAGAGHGGHGMGDVAGMAMSGMMTTEQMAALAQAEGDAFDRAWLEMMIAHHEGAIEMATQVKASTGNPDVAALADAIIAAQAEEIDTMRDLLAG